MRKLYFLFAAFVTVCLVGCEDRKPLSWETDVFLPLLDDRIGWLEFVEDTLDVIVTNGEPARIVLSQAVDLTSGTIAPVLPDTSIEENIGISKDFNIYELQDALGKKDIFKSNQIIKHFSENPKNLKKWADDIKETYKIFGQNKLEPTKSEIKMRILARRSIVALKDIKKNEKITKFNTCLKRLENGMKQKDLE